jgi:hypothetical protein
MIYCSSSGQFVTVGLDGSWYVTKVKLSRCYGLVMITRVRLSQQDGLINSGHIVTVSIHQIVALLRTNRDITSIDLCLLAFTLQNACTDSDLFLFIKLYT